MIPRLTLQDMRDFFDLPYSEKQKIADWLEVRRENALENDGVYFRRVLVAAGARGLLLELTRRVAAARG